MIKEILFRYFRIIRLFIIKAKAIKINFCPPPARCYFPQRDSHTLRKKAVNSESIIIMSSQQFYFDRVPALHNGKISNLNFVFLTEKGYFYVKAKLCWSFLAFFLAMCSFVWICLWLSSCNCEILQRNSYPRGIKWQQHEHD